MYNDQILKSETDIFWNNRPALEPDPQKVNISDLVQRDLESDFILTHLNNTDSVLEVGCGNGFLTSLLRENVSSVHAFDFSENMIAQAKAIYGEKNNKFFQDNVLNPAHILEQYDVVVCVRVLINLRDFNEQEKALKNVLSFVKTGGKLILIEGFIDGFNALNKIRNACKIEKMCPASINYYSALEDFTKLFSSNFSIQETFHTGMFDFLTRIIYPALVGSQNASGPSEFHQKIASIVKTYNPEQMKSLARLQGWALVKN